MAFYTVLAPPDSDPIATGDVVFVKDGFNWPALFFPLIWSVYRRQWLVLLLLLAAILILVLVGGTVGWALYLLGRLWFALEANGLRRWTLERNGHRMLDVTEGRTIEQAERRFFAESYAEPTATTSSTDDRQPPTANPRRTTAGTGIVGLFPSPHPTR